MTHKCDLKWLFANVTDLTEQVSVWKKYEKCINNTHILSVRTTAVLGQLKFHCCTFLHRNEFWISYHHHAISPARKSCRRTNSKCIPCYILMSNSNDVCWNIIVYRAALVVGFDVNFVSETSRFFSVVLSPLETEWFSWYFFMFINK